MSRSNASELSMPFHLPPVDDIMPPPAQLSGSSISSQVSGSGQCGGQQSGRGILLMIFSRREVSNMAGSEPAHDKRIPSSVDDLFAAMKNPPSN